MRHLFILLFALTILLSCTGSKKINLEIPPIQYLDFKSLGAPNTSFEPGYIFRITKDKKQIYVTSLSTRNFVKEDDIQFPSQIKRWKYGTLFKFLAPKQFGNFNYNKSRKLNVEFSLDNCKVEQLSDENIKMLLKRASIDVKADNRYYVVAETISTKNMNLNIKDGIDRDAGFSNLLNGYKAEGNFTKSGQDSSILKKAFDRPYRIMYKVTEFTAKGPMLGEGKSFELGKATGIYILDELSN